MQLHKHIVLAINHKEIIGSYDTYTHDQYWSDVEVKQGSTSKCQR